MSSTSPLVSTQYLSEHLAYKDMRLLDCSWYLPNANRDCAEEFKTVHIPGAVYFDIDGVAELATNLPHMVAAPQKFQKKVGELGIRETDTIVVYDSAGLLSAARVWWNFSIMGAKRVFVLDGGLPKWLAEQRPVSSDMDVPTHRAFKAQFVSDSVVAFPELAHMVTAETGITQTQIVDVRPASRFDGQEEEPRPGLRSGKMPGSINVPFSDLVVDGHLLDKASIRQVLENAGIDISRPIISSCGSGVTAPILNLALAVLGIDAMRVYDGSWAEWGAKAELPVIGSGGQKL